MIDFYKIPEYPISRNASQLVPPANTCEKIQKKTDMTDVISVFRAPKNSPEKCLPIGTLQTDLFKCILIKISRFKGMPNVMRILYKTFLVPES